MRLPRLRLRTLLVLVAVIATATALGLEEWKRRLADDTHQFYTHEEALILALVQDSDIPAADFLRLRGADENFIWAAIARSRL